MQSQLWPYGPLLPGGAQLQSAPAAAAQPFPGRSALFTILAAWQLVVQPILPQHLPQGQPEDNPPFGQRTWLSSVLASWEPGPPERQPRNFVVQEGAAAAEAPVLNTRPWLQAVLQNWQLADPLPTLPRHFGLEQPEDDPPFGQRTWLSSILASWIPPDPTPSTLRFIVQGVEVNDPPFGQRSWLVGILDRWWQPPDPLPAGRPVFPLEQPEDDPPFGQRTWLPTVIASWTPPDPTPSTVRLVVQGVEVNDPPFGQRSWLPQVIASWTPADLPAQGQRLFVHEAEVDNPPFGQRPWLATTIDSWRPPDPPLQGARYAPIPAPQVDDPPFGQRPWLDQVIKAWQPLPDLPARPAVQAPVAISFTTFGVITRNLQMPGMTVYFEATLKTSDATYPCQARLFNITDSSVVGSSTISTASLTATRVRSAGLTLAAAAKEYRVEFGGQAGVGATYTIHSGDLIFGG